jgi:hypothetical protein
MRASPPLEQHRPGVAGWPYHAPVANPHSDPLVAPSPPAASLTQVRPLLHPRDPAGYHRAWATVCSNRTHTPRTGSPPGPVRAPPPPADAFGNTIGPVVRWGPPSPWGACRWLSFAPDIRRSDLLPESFPMPNTSSPRSPAHGALGGPTGCCLTSTHLTSRFWGHPPPFSLAAAFARPRPLYRPTRVLLDPFGRDTPSRCPDRSLLLPDF